METKIFLDSGDPLETKACIAAVGEIHGQTTNPTLVARNPEIAKRIDAGNGFTETSILEMYKLIVNDIAAVIPDGYISVEVPATADTRADELIAIAREMSLWTARTHIKLPTTLAGIEAAHMLGKSGFNLNMTLLFSQQQAAAIYEATMDDIFGEVYISPFVGRLDDAGRDGRSLIKNIQTMLKTGDTHVKVLMASIRDVETIIWGFENGVDAITAPLHLWEEWAAAGKPKELTEEQREALAARGTPIEYEEIDLRSEVNSFEVSHDLTDAGLNRFTEDWESLIVT